MGDSRISVVFGATAPGTPVELRFKLYNVSQSAASHQWKFGLKNTSTGYYYNELASPNPGYYGSGFHGLYPTVWPNPQPNDWSYLGGDIPGSALASTPGDWSFMKFQFTPGTGVVISLAITNNAELGYADSSLTYRQVAHWWDMFNMSSVNQLFFDNSGAQAHWQVDDVEIDGTVPEPSSILALAVGMVGMIGAVRRKH